MKNIRLGLMGCGIVARFRHLPAIQMLDGIEKTALFSPTLQPAKELADAFGFDAAFSDEDKFWDSNLNLVVVTSPPWAHLDNIRSAAAHGVDVICEKPLALTDEDCKAIQKLVAESGIRLYVTFCYRFSTVSQTIKHLIVSKAIGDLRTLRFVFNWDCRGKYSEPEGKVLNVRRDFRMKDGGPLVDCGVHQIDLARFWSGSEPVHWCGHGSWADDYETPDHVWVHLDHANGIHTMVECSFSYGHQCPNTTPVYAYDIIGTDGFIHYEKATRNFELHNANGIEKLPFDDEKDFLAMYKAILANRNGNGSETLPSCDDGLIATCIARTATEQAMKKRITPNTPLLQK